MFSDKSDPQDERAKKSLAGLAASLGGDEEERPFLREPAKVAEPSTWDKVSVELKKNWWMWSTVAFVVLLLGSLYVFRDSLYNSDTNGLPVLAVKDDASEACQTECTEELDKLKKEKPSPDLDDVKGKEIYDTCYTKCVSDEAKDIVQERAKYKKEEEEAEKEEEKEKKGEEKEKGEEEEEQQQEEVKREKKKKKKAKEEDEEEEEEGAEGGRRLRRLLTSSRWLR
eukprot:jgi/Botrbrau1/13353/Bobra.0158s0007.1